MDMDVLLRVMRELTYRVGLRIDDGDDPSFIDAANEAPWSQEEEPIAKALAELADTIAEAAAIRMEEKLDALRDDIAEARSELLEAIDERVADSKL